MFALFLIVCCDSLLGRAVARPLVPQIDFPKAAVSAGSQRCSQEHLLLYSALTLFHAYLSLKGGKGMRQECLQHHRQALR